MIEMTKELLLELEELAEKHDSGVASLTRSVAPGFPENRSYIKGVIDGVENTSHSSFMKGAMAMYRLLMKKESEKHAETDTL